MSTYPNPFGMGPMLPPPEEGSQHKEDVLRADSAEDRQDALASHRLASAHHNRVACYCSVGIWRTLDEYGEHIESLVLRDYVIPEESDAE